MNYEASNVSSYVYVLIHKHYTGCWLYFEALILDLFWQLAGIIDTLYCIFTATL